MSKSSSSDLGYPLDGGGKGGAFQNKARREDNGDGERVVLREKEVTNKTEAMIGWW